MGSLDFWFQVSFFLIAFFIGAIPTWLLSALVWWFLLGCRAWPHPARAWFGILTALVGLIPLAICFMLDLFVKVRTSGPDIDPLINIVVGNAVIFMPVMFTTGAIDLAACKGYPVRLGVSLGLISPLGIWILLILPNRLTNPPGPEIQDASPTAILAVRITSALASLASLIFGVWFVVHENDRPGLSFGLAYVFMPFLLTIFVLAATKRQISIDVWCASWIALLMSVAGLAFFMSSFQAWRIIAVVWACLHILIAVTMVIARRKVRRYNVYGRLIR